MAPVKFYRKSKSPIQPYYISPWQGENRKFDDPVLAPLRGDFFCMPFGLPSEYRGEKYLTHGETAAKKWSFVSARKVGAVVTLTASMETRIRTGTVTKRIFLVDGQNVVYIQHLLKGYTGRMSLGHHATLALPEEPGSARITTSPIIFGMTNPSAAGNPAEGSYYSLAIGKKFRNLSKVPLVWADKPTGNCSALPVRKGFTDALACFNRPGKTPAWTTATFEKQHYLWFSIKDTAVLPTALQWLSNCGKQQPPWNGRNVCVGLEDICAYFAEGLKPSVLANHLSRAGIATFVRLSPRRPTLINYIQGVVEIPPGFKKVRSARFDPGQVTFTSSTGHRVTTQVNHKFVTAGEL